MAQSLPGGRLQQVEELGTAAIIARQNAYTPYSKFKVGAALLANSGKIYTGCNVENASFGLTICAERVAFFKAISEGEHMFDEIVICTDEEEPSTPCGACRQVMSQFVLDTFFIVTLIGLKTQTYPATTLTLDVINKVKAYGMNDLLPHPFSLRVK